MQYDKVGDIKRPFASPYRLKPWQIAASGIAARAGERYMESMRQGRVREYAEMMWL